MPHGTVLWFNSEKGYGYIKAKDGSEIFVRENSIQSEGLRLLETNDKVSFEIDWIQTKEAPKPLEFASSNRGE